MNLKKDNISINDTLKVMELAIENEVNKRMQNLTAHIVIDRELVDCDSVSVTNCEVYAEISTPLFFPESKTLGTIGRTSK